MGKGGGHMPLLMNSEFPLQGKRIREKFLVSLLKLDKQ
jgi:hypothetical protein